MPKKKFQVIKATTREIPGLYVGGREKHFAKNGTFETNDPGEAAEIDKVLGAKGTGEVVVVPNEQKEHGHNYTFGASQAFRNAWEAFEQRRKNKRISLVDRKPKKIRKHGRAPRKAAAGAEVTNATT